MIALRFIGPAISLGEIRDNLPYWFDDSIIEIEHIAIWKSIDGFEREFVVFISNEDMSYLILSNPDVEFEYKKYPDYKSHYDRLIIKASLRKLDTYVEIYHIVPKCMGGTNDKSNLAELTPEEHYVAHQLLVKIYPKSKELIYSAIMMTGGKDKRSSNKAHG